MEKQALQYLKEYHDKRGHLHEPPKYSITQNGLKFISTCEYREFKTTGEGTSKSTANRLAAQLMLNKLTNGVVGKLGNHFEENKSKAIEIEQVVQNKTCVNLTEEEIKKVHSFVKRHKPSIELFRKLKSDIQNIDCALKDVNIGMKAADAPFSKTLSIRQYTSMYLVEYFEKVMNEMGLMFCCEIMDVDPKTQMHVAMIKIGFNGITAAGSGNTLEVAVTAACRNALKILVILKK